MRTFLPLLLAAAVLGACTVDVAGTATPGASTRPAPQGSTCPPTDKTLAGSSSFEVLVQDADGKPVAGVKVAATRTPRDPAKPCAKYKDVGEATTGTDGKASVYALVAGTYTIKVGGKATAPATLDLDGPAGTYLAVTGGDEVAFTKYDPTVLKSRHARAYAVAKKDLPEAGQKSFTIASADVAAAFGAWVADPADLPQDVDYTKERLVALYKQALTPGCFMGVVFRTAGAEITWKVEGEIPKGILCAPMLLPDGPYWGVAAIPAGEAPVQGTEPLTLDAAWLKP